MLNNNLDPEVGETPEDLVVYGGTGRTVIQETAELVVGPNEGTDVETPTDAAVAAIDGEVSAITPKSRVSINTPRPSHALGTFAYAGTDESLRIAGPSVTILQCERV